MRECKKCKEVKFNWQFVRAESPYPLNCLGYYRKSWLCKECAKEIARKKILEELAKYQYNKIT
ncbi:MAG: hypothetical protein PHW73_13890 [Atribacterota bacterium]|nr:hypothetical protein [Atribacterota bacterium]